MVTLEQIKEFMRKRAEEDRQIRSVQVSGETLEEALKTAAVELGLTVRKLEYDVLQKGSKGLLGAGKRNWSLIAYENVKAMDHIAQDEVVNFDQEWSQVPEEDPDAPGKAFVRLFQDGAYLKVIKPRGSGATVDEDDVLEILHSRAVRDVNRQALKGTVKLATGHYAKVGEFIHNPAADASLVVDLEDQDMRCTMTLTTPKPGGADLSKEDVEHFLRNYGIVHGVMSEELDKLIDEPRYGERILVAQGSKPVNGRDAKIQYFFDTSMKVKPQEIGGKVDFKALNNIHNVLKGEELARKEPAEKGVTGRTVTGKALPAKDGKDVSIDMGNNVQLSKDGLRVLSTADGQVILTGGRISVETVMVIPGDVSTQTGDINVFGSVIVKGNVEDGFTVKAAGNIEVMGNVGKSQLDTPGDIVVHQGINGNGGGLVKAGRNIWSRFIQNANVEADGYIIVTDGIIHSKINSMKKILCRGKRAKIVGGHLKAAEEINASALGATGAGETILEVGFDPKGKEELEALILQKEKLDKDVQELNLNLLSLEKQKRIRKELPPEKETALKDMKLKSQVLNSELHKVSQLLETKQGELDSFRLMGKISSAGPVYPGVRIIIKDEEFTVLKDYNAVTFVRDGNIIKYVKYQDFEEEEIVGRS